MANLDLWKSVEDIDPDFTKPITGKDYRGTSPNPHYLIKLATEKLGPAGHGFGWEVIAEGFEHMGETVLHWCRIRFWWRNGKEVGGFESYGQTKAAYKTRNGDLRVDEDAPKKSMTDALTKALAQIGFGANIFLGRWDDSKYVDHVREEYRERAASERTQEQPQNRNSQNQRPDSPPQQVADPEAEKTIAQEKHAKRCVTATNKLREGASISRDELVNRWSWYMANQPEVAKDPDVRAVYDESIAMMEAAE